MRPDVEAATRRVRQMRTRAGGFPPGGTFAHEVENALGNGYAVALEGDAWLMGAERALEAMIEDTSRAASAKEIRARLHDLRRFKGKLAALRDELAALRGEHERPALPAHGSPAA
jgi:hypothetical protein